MKNQVPAQQEGGSLDATAKVQFNSIESAKEFYEIAKLRLLNVSGWAEICKVPLSTFILCDEKGNEVNRLAITGDLLKIDIPGPGPTSGEGYDWVKIEKITEDVTGDISITSLQARPAANPLNEDPAVAHFFTEQATSTFQVKLIGSIVTAEEHGRNEVPNTDTSHLADNIRNTLIGWSARIGLSFPQWKSLVKGIVETEPTQ